MAFSSEASFKVGTFDLTELLKDPAVLADLERRAKFIANYANADGLHVVRSEIGPRRARAAVITADWRAVRAESQDHNLTRAIDAARGTSGG